MDTKALRQKILDLAIRGQLVPQDPTDEPASVLLERIRAEKQQMVKDGKLKAKDIKNDTVIFVGEDNLHYEKFADGSVKCIEDEIPFELPEGWAWSRLISLSSIITDGEHKTPRRINEFQGYYLLSARNIQNGFLVLTDVDFVDKSEFENISQRCNPKDNDILISCSGSIGRVTVVNDGNDYVMVRSAAMVRTISINPYYLMFALQSGQLQTQMQRASKQTAQANLFLGAIQSLLVPLPPESECHRIVPAINSLLKIADVIASERDQLFELVRTTKSKILDLAIRGQLVPQDPNDEPASVLLERIRAEKEALIKAGKLKRDKKESIIFRGDDNSYYLRTGELEESLVDWRFDDLPKTWGICCLGEVCDYGDCINVDTADIDDGAWILDLEDIEKDTGVVLKKVTKAQRNSVSTKHQFHSGQVLYSKLRPYLNKVVLSDDDGYCTSEILPLEFDRCVLPAYARYYLMSGTFLDYADRCSYGVKMPRLGTVDGKKAILSLPPLAEQKRIVETIESYFFQLNKISEALA